MKRLAWILRELLLLAGFYEWLDIFARRFIRTLLLNNIIQMYVINSMRIWYFDHQEHETKWKGFNFGLYRYIHTYILHEQMSNKARVRNYTPKIILRWQFDTLDRGSVVIFVFFLVTFLSLCTALYGVNFANAIIVFQMRFRRTSSGSKAFHITCPTPCVDAFDRSYMSSL